MGDSVAWKYEYFTMDDRLSAVVTDTFVSLYEQGLIYRGKRLVNWDPVLLSAVSDLEVENEERAGTMWHILYPFSDGPQPDAEGKPSRGMHIATTRPETMLADGALAVHPDDERYKHLVGKMVDLPLCDRKIPIIADAYVDKDFGSGCVKITGAHDFNDYQVAMRHGLPLITIFTLDAKINEQGPRAYQGLDRYDARKEVLADLETQGFLEKAVPHQHAVPICVRTGQVVEPMLTDQWFVAMTKAGRRRHLDRRQGDRGGRDRRGEVLSGAVDQHLQPVDAQHPGLVHLAPALVGDTRSRPGTAAAASCSSRGARRRRTPRPPRRATPAR
jgi:valyl-tRNA synthetase